MNKSVVILGAGYGGLMTAVKLETKTNAIANLEIVLLDRNPYHQYVHLAYEIVSNVKKVSDLTLPMTELLTNRKIRFVQAVVNEIDLHNKTVKTDKTEIPYDELVIALGNEPDFYGIKGAEEFSLAFNSVESADKIRDELRKIFSENKNPTIVIGGGGFTGIELAGEILDEYNCCVTIVEGANEILPSWNEPEFSQKVASVLTDMGAKLLIGKFIVEVKPHSVTLRNGSEIEASVFIWTAGVQASTLVKKSGLKTGKNNRALINEYCEAVDFPGVYVVGDSALVADSETGEIFPQCIEIALQQAEIAAENIFADLEGKQKTVYHPKFNGLILAVGERYGIGRIYGRILEGKVAQIVKRLIHLQYVYEIAGLKKVVKENL
jgi:NADH dehydrogenase